jgi:hypothetical protein
VCALVITICSLHLWAIIKIYVLWKVLGRNKIPKECSLLQLLYWSVCLIILSRYTTATVCTGTVWLNYRSLSSLINSVIHKNVMHYTGRHKFNNSILDLVVIFWEWKHAACMQLLCKNRICNRDMMLSIISYTVYFLCSVVRFLGTRSEPL